MPLYSDYGKQGALAAELAREQAAQLWADKQLTDNEQNAYRHSLWIALMIGVYGNPHDVALLLGMAHEMDGHDKNSLGLDDSKVDLHNNRVGSQIGDAALVGNMNGAERMARIKDTIYGLVRNGRTARPAFTGQALRPGWARSDAARVRRRRPRRHTALRMRRPGRER